MLEQAEPETVPFVEADESTWIGRLALERQHIKCQGRTPEATMASALYTDVKRKGDRSVFTRSGPVP